MIGFFILYIGSIVLTVIFNYPHLKYDNFMIASLIVFIFAIISYIITHVIGPGIFILIFLFNNFLLGTVNKQENSSDLLKLYQEFDAWEICTDCIIYKPKRSRHCEICNQCIIVYDHHCPWINNCVLIYLN